MIINQCQCYVQQEVGRHTTYFQTKPLSLMLLSETLLYVVMHITIVQLLLQRSKRAGVVGVGEDG